MSNETFVLLAILWVICWPAGLILTLIFWAAAYYGY